MVLGASASQIVVLLSWDFLKLVLLAMVLSVPASYFVMQRWLSDFAYRIEVSPFVFLAGGLVILVVAFFSVGSQSYKLALSDPTECLREE